MAFDLSLLKVLDIQPWRWTTEPIYDNGPLNPPTTPGVKQTLNGVFVLMSDDLVDMLRQNLTQAEKDEIAPWVNRYPMAQCALWNVPVWGGQDSAVYWRIPANVWNDPTTVPPLKVRRYFANLFREDD